ncbi:S8 family serine peptidase [Ferruginibacter sp. SUN002]|uniref:S8 family serine peptidase n=1 Tax=Ferruginibacter sp. SUN002 TaxID=2937789 RepID=UPI003D35A2EE
MKKISFTTAFIALSTLLFAQKDNSFIMLKTGAVKTERNILQGSFKRESISKMMFRDKYYVLIQFSSIPTEALLAKLKSNGINLDNYISGTTYLASIKKGFDFSSSKNYAIASIVSLSASYKVDEKIRTNVLLNDKEDPLFYAVSLYGSMDKAIAEKELINAGAKIHFAKQATANVIFIEQDKSILDSIAAMPFVKYISLQSLKDKPLNYKNIGAHGISSLNISVGKNLNGRNVTIGVGDNADISSHIDFSGRLINRTPWIFEDHGTHTSATAAGAGILNVKNHGMAPKSTIVSQFFSDIITNAPTYVNDYNMVITNNSYYAGQNGCIGEGEYDEFSIFADEQTNNFPQLLHIVAAGNDGELTCSPYPKSFATVKSGWQCSKNALTVGSIKTLDYTVASFSGRGPVQDGRIKPEICAGGFQIISAMKNNRYDSANGTSMSAPTVAGALALVYERYRQLHAGSDPSAALIKAIACNTAEDIGNPGPDYTFGFGMLNARRAVEAIDSSRYIIDSISNGENKLHTISLAQSANKLKILLYWNDKEAAVNATNSLVNDLDLTVTTPGSVLYKPLILNPAAANVNANAVQGIDHVNNIEQIVIDNPTAGNYSVNINGFALPFGKRSYTLTYEIVKPAIVVEYPAGGETLVPGEQEYIRWNAHGNTGNNFTVEYSTNNGAAWTTISNAVPSTTTIYPWTVPSTVTNTALIKVSENNTASVDQTDFNFTILGQPVVTATNVCEGAVRLLWQTIAGATTYDVLKLVGDSMQVISNTTDTFALITDLDKHGSYWFGVRAKNGANPGRRSVSVNVTPNDGVCVLAVFNNDIKVDSILEPTTARKFFVDAGNAVKPVKVRIKNNGSINVTTPFDVSYSVDGVLIANETVNTPIPAGASINYTFSTMYPILPNGFSYDFKAWTNNYTPDLINNNDTAFKVVKLIMNDTIHTLPVFEGFETMPAGSFINGTMAIGDNQRLDFSANSTKGRARSFVNTGFAKTGIKAMTLDQTPLSESTTVDSLTFSYNLVTQVGTQLRYDFYYRNHGQSNNPSNKVWVRGSENDAWVEAYDLYTNQAELGQWAHAVININEVLDNAIPSQIVSATTQVRFGQEGYTSANSVAPEIDIDDGYTFDDITLKSAVNDVVMKKIVTPAASSCSLSSSEPITVQIKNYNNNTFNNLEVSYQINDEPVVTEVIKEIEPLQSLDYVFSQTADLSAFEDYSIKVWVNYSGDNYPENDSLLNFKIRSSPVINSYPYLEGFENNDGYFYAKGTNTSWQWGAPAKTVINKAANGNKAWVTNLIGNYSNNETSYLYSPCFDLTGLVQPVLAFSHIYSIEFAYDYTWVEYSTDGTTWQKLGEVGSGTNWYDGTALNVWKTSKLKWHATSIGIPVTASVVRFRFVLSSDAGVTEAGIGIDDVHVFDKAAIYSGIPLNNITQNVSGNDWVNFTAVGRRVAAINPNGNNLGSTTIQVYPYTAIVRNSNNQYYANRNIVIQSSNPPSGNIGIRMYFTIAEADSLINAIGCGTCIRPTDPYELGVTKFSGNTANENGTIADNFSGYYSFILPDNTTIIPYDSGYYAEFTVNSLSEFWLSKATIAPAAVSACIGNTLTFKASNYGSSFQWQVNNGTGYTNIINGANYSGATTNTLQLINLPGSNAGYKYRCVVNGVNGPDNVLHFTSVWTGTTNNDWFTATNWSCGVVPDQYTDVVIPSGLSVYPTVTANATVKSIRVNTNATLTVLPTYKLDVLGN